MQKSLYVPKYSPQPDSIIKLLLNKNRLLESQPLTTVFKCHMIHLTNKSNERFDIYRREEMQLGEIAFVRTGLVLNRKKPDPTEKVLAVYNIFTLKNITEYGRINLREIEKFSSTSVLDGNYFTQKNDILMRLSYPHTAIFVDGDHEGLLIPSSFAVIRVSEGDILPEYLTWYLNTKEIKNQLEKAHAGSRIPSTNKQVLKSLPIRKPILERQKSLIDVFKLHLKEQDIYQRLIEEKAKQFESYTQILLQTEEETI